MSRRLVALFIAASGLLLAGCDGGSRAPSTSSTAAPSPTAPARRPRPPPPPILNADAPTLARIHATLDEIATTNDRQRRAELAGSLAPFRTAATPAILERLSLKSPGACAALAQTFSNSRDPRAVPALIGIVDAVRAEQKNATYVFGATRSTAEFDRDECASYAIIALGDIADPRATDSLIAELARRRTSPTGSALGSLRDPRAIPALFVALPHDMNESVQTGLQLFGREVLGPARDAVINADPVVRTHTVRFLSTRSLFAAPAEVAPLLADAAPSVRAEAADALGRFKGVPLATWLLPRLQDTAPEVRLAAATALVRHGDRRGQDTLVAEIAARIKDNRERRDHAYSDVVGALIDEGHRLQGLAAEAADPRLVPSLGLFLEDWHAPLREGAAFALGRTGGPQAIDALVGGLADWRSGAACADALARLQWKPRTDAERVHLLFARHDRAALKADAAMPAVVRADIETGDARALQAAILMVVGLGRTELEPALISRLDRQGTRPVAEMLLNSGDATLAEAARRWGARRGLVVRTDVAMGSIGWGAP